MNFASVGDMAQMFRMQRQNTAIKQEMSRLTNELTTGKVADTGAAVSGDYTALAGIDRSLATLTAYKFTTSEAAELAASMQAVTTNLGDITDGFGSAVLTASSAVSPTMIDAAANSAKQKFESAVAALNTNTSGRYLFSGQTTDVAPLADAEDILASLQAVASAETTPADAIAAIDDWFSAPVGGGGYLDVAYQGGDPLPAFRVSDGETASLTVTAADENVKAVLKSLAMGALLADGLFAGDNVSRITVAQSVGERLISVSSNISSLGGDIGATEERIDLIATRNSNQSSALEIARSKIVGVDEYDSATALEALQTQMESLYTLTARLANLSLTDYM